jgi:hypothetical protein
MSTFVTAQIYILWICYFLTHVSPELKVLKIHKYIFTNIAYKALILICTKYFLITPFRTVLRQSLRSEYAD